MTQHNVRTCSATVCKVSERWSCKDVDGGRHHPNFVWQGRLFPLTWERHHSIKLDGNLEPKLSHVSASDKMNSLNNESSWDLCMTSRWAPSLVGHGLLISDKSIDSRPLCGCSTFSLLSALHCQEMQFLQWSLSCSIFADQGEKAVLPRRQDRGRNIWTAVTEKYLSCVFTYKLFSSFQVGEKWSNRIHVCFFAKYIQTLIIPSGNTFWPW